MEHCDVLVVGGGPAGSTCAWRLAAAGLEVVVMDRARFPRDKVCAGWITPAVLEELAIDAADYARGRVLQPITAFRTGLIGGAAVTSDYRRPVSFGIRRCEFDHYLLERSGARVVQAALSAMERVGDGWVVNGELCTPLVVGAGGHFCPVARMLGPGAADPRLVVAAQELEFELTAADARACSVRPGVPELYFCQDLRGYGWVLRKGPVLNVGLGRTDQHHLARHVAAFVADLARRGKVPADLPERLHGHAYLLYPQPRPRPLFADGVLLVGDAAGLAYAQSGEGIRPAVESALLAAEVIIAARGDYTSAALAPYVQRLTARFGARTVPPPGPGTGLIEQVKRLAGRRLLASRRFARHVVLDRWFLHRHQPPLRAAQVVSAGRS